MTRALPRLRAERNLTLTARFAYVVNGNISLLPLLGFTAQYICILRRGECNLMLPRLRVERNLTLTARFAYVVSNNISLLPLLISVAKFLIKYVAGCASPLRYFVRPKEKR